MSPIDTFISVVAPLYNDEKNVRQFIEETLDILQKNYLYYEIILIDDYSSDGTVNEVETALKIHEGIRLVRLSRKFGEDAAILAGLDTAIGDFVVVMVPNNDPPHIIPQMIELALKGAGGVIGIRSNRQQEPLWLRVGAKVFYYFANRVFNIPIPENSSQFRVFSRQVVNAITQIRGHYRYIRMVSNLVGYSQETFIYTPIKRTNKGLRLGLLGYVHLALDVIIANSGRPLRIVTGLGLIASILNLFYITYMTPLKKGRLLLLKRAKV